jgi:hypothetical protein
VRVYQGRASFEIGIEVKLSGGLYNLAELIQLVDQPRGRAYRNPTARDDEGVVRAVAGVASAFREVGQRFLDSDPALEDELRAQRQRLGEEMAISVLARQVRPRADHAFRTGDYATAAELLSRIEPSLSPSEREKLRLARARAATGAR